MRKPDFIIAGVAKAGTTSLYRYLGEHPDIGLSSKKEVNYFAHGDPHIHKGWPHLPFPATSWDAYLQQFQEVAGLPVVGEASPIYFESPQAPKAIAERLPAAKIIISLRNPVERAYSGYLMHVRDGEPELTDDQIVASQDRFISGGFYSEKLGRYLHYFPREQVEIVLFDDLRARPHIVLQRLFEFLGVGDTGFEAQTARYHNKGSYPRMRWLNAWLKSDVVRQRLAPAMPSWVRRAGHKLVQVNSRRAPQMSDSLRARLRELYRSDIEQVAAVIDRDLSQWL